MTFTKSILIPCFNETQTIEEVIKRVENEISINDEIIIIDDFSNDGTREKIKKINKKNIKTIFLEKNLGKGNALKEGLKLSENEIVIIQDADLEYNPADYKKLMLPFEEVNADIVYGSRFMGTNKYVRVHLFLHFIANKLLTFLCNIFTNLNMTDMETGYKVFKKNVIKSINLEEKSFGIEPEITIKLAKKKFRFFEVPISYSGRNYNEGKKIGLKDAFRAVFCIFKYGIFR